MRTANRGWPWTAVRIGGTGYPDRRENQFVRIQSLVVLDFEIAEELLARGQHRCVEQVGNAQPSIQGIEVVPYADKRDLLAPVEVDLACDLGVDESLVGPHVFESPQGPDPEVFDLLGRDPTLEDPDYQVFTPRALPKPPRHSPG